MSMCVRDIDFAYFHNVSIIFQKCSDREEFIVFHFIYGSNLISNAPKNIPQYITIFHIRFHRHQIFSNRHRENKTTPTFATSAGEPGQISRNYPTETSVHIQHVPL